MGPWTYSVRVTPGFELNFRSLEPQPWPSHAVLNELRINKPLAETLAVDSWVIFSLKNGGSFRKFEEIAASLEKKNILT